MTGVTTSRRRLRGPLQPDPSSGRPSIVRMMESVAAALPASSAERLTQQQNAAAEPIVFAYAVHEATVRIRSADAASQDSLQPWQHTTAIMRLSSEDAVLLLLEAGVTVPCVVSTLEGLHLRTLAKDEALCNKKC